MDERHGGSVEMGGTCPHCGEPVSARAVICTQCGVDLRTGGPVAHILPEEDSGKRELAELNTVNTREWLSVCAGAIVAVVFLLVPRLCFMGRYLCILVHETGHWLANLTVGVISLPCFDFQYGGGVTVGMTRTMMLVALVYAGFAWLLWLCRGNRSLLVLLLVSLAAYACCAHVQRFRETYVYLAGHGFELVVAGIFAYRAFSGALVHEGERPAYAFCAAFLILVNARFALRLLVDSEARTMYENHPAGHLNDFVAVAQRWHAGLGTIAAGHLLACAFPILIGLAIHRYRERILAATFAD